MADPDLNRDVPGERPTVDTFWEEGRHWALGDDEPTAATSDLITAAEEKFEIRLPDLLKELYRHSNGGYTAFTSYPKVSHPGSDDSDWFCVLLDRNIYPVHRLETLGDIADITEFGIEDENFRNRTMDADRIIILSRHGWDLMLCLDYSATSENPEIVYLEEEGGKGIVELLRVSDFDTFFRGLRREG